MTNSDIRTVNRFQYYIVKKIQGFPICICSDMCESKVGLYKLTCIIDIRKLYCLHKLLGLPFQSVFKQLFIRKYILYSIDKNQLNLALFQTYVIYCANTIGWTMWMTFFAIQDLCQRPKHGKELYS